MKKKILTLFVVLICAVTGVFGFVGCDSAKDDDTYYILTGSGIVDKSSYVIVEKGEFRDENETKTAYKKSGDQVTFGYTALGIPFEGSGVLRDGILKLNTVLGEMVYVTEEVSDLLAVAADGLEYVLNDSEDGYVVKGVGTATNKFLRIPYSYNNLPVTGIAESALSGCDKLKVVVIPNSVESIGAYAFDWCSKLSCIIIPDSVKDIGPGVFEGCKKLTQVAITGEIDSIGGHMFKDCRSLKNVIVPDSVTSIGMGAFEGCRKLEIIVILDNVTSIGDHAFKGCRKLSDEMIPKI